MLLLLRKNTSDDDLRALADLARRLGYGLDVLGRAGRVVELTRGQSSEPGAATVDPHGHRSVLEDLAFVERVLEHDDAPERTARGAGPETSVGVGDAHFGAGAFSIIAGPCAVEAPEALFEVAESVRAAGATLLRAGAYKPRSSPYSFQGLGQPGLELLARVKQATGLALVTEVLDPRLVGQVQAVADMLQVGSRSMSNVTLLKEIGRTRTPVLLKRGLAASVREFVLAAEYILAEGNPNVVLCERGVRGFDSITRNMLDLGAVAYLKQTTHLPVVVDPSHAAGRPDLVAPLAKAGIVAGADGLIIEVHPRPGEVRSDGAQALSPAAFHDLVRAARPLVELAHKKLCTVTPAVRS